MNWQFFLILIMLPFLAGCLAHVRLVEVTSSTTRSILFPQQQWQARNLSQKAYKIDQTMQLRLIKLENSSVYCEPEDFEHNYELRAENGSFTVQLHVNHFQRTKAGELAIMRDLCLDAQGLPVRRLCVAGTLTATWHQLHNVTCRTGNKLSQQIHELLNKPVRLSQLRYLLSQAPGHLLAPVDIYSTAQIFGMLLQQPQRHATLGGDLISICREIMSSDAQVLRLSAQLNATNSLLSKFEDYMDALPQQFVPQESCGKTLVQTKSKSAENGVETINYADIGVQALMTSNLSIFYVNPICDKVTGIAIYSTPAPDRRHSSSGGFWYRFLYSNESLEKLRREPDLETATYLPEQLWNQLKSRGASYLILKVYAHDGLFVEASEQRSRRPRSKVLSISLPGFEAAELPGELPFLLRKDNPLKSPGNNSCGYWNYETWLENGVTTCNQSSAGRDENVLCHAQHLTQFSFLVGGSYAQLQSTVVHLDGLLEEDEQLLDILTFIGCGLSLFGLICIFLTAALVEKWRSQASTKVLLHLCLALALQLLLFGYLTGLETSEKLKENWSLCIISGAALQYSVLVIFSWMLIIAFLQFQRYVTVIGVARPPHYILISALAAWLLPLLPTLLVVLLDAESYRPSAYQLNTHTAALCYPSGYGLALGVVLPIALVTIANCFMMICIIYSIYQALNPRRQHIIQQLRLSVLLFFLLGLTWIFGLCTYLHLGIIFSYLFCLTATLQGFVLFVYFVLLNTMNRRAWLRLICPSQMKADVPSRSTTRLQSITTSSTNCSNRTKP